MSEERRQYSRLEGQEHILVDVIAGASVNQTEVFDCNSRDFSFNGVRLHGNHGFELGSQIALTVHMQYNHTDYQLIGKVKWVTETTENEHLAGVELLPEQSKDIEKWQAIFTL